MKYIRIQRGFTLVEILIALTISAIMLLGVGKIFDLTKRGYIVNDAESRMQENARLAMYFLSRDFRQAGMMGCRNGLSARAGSALGAENLLANAVNHENNYLTGTGATTVLHAAVADRVVSAAVPAWQPGNTVVGTDIVTIRGAFSSGRLTDAVANNTNIPLDNSDDFFQPGDRLLITDCEKVSIASVTLEDPAFLTINDNLMLPYLADSEVFKLDTVFYYIRNNPDGIPSLYRGLNNLGIGDVDELIEGVENLRLLYGEDTNNDARPDRYVPAGTPGVVMDNVVALRVSLLMRALRNDVDGNRAEAYDLFGTIINTNDALRRDVYTMTISFRNSVVGI